MLYVSLVISVRANTGVGINNVLFTIVSKVSHSIENDKLLPAVVVYFYRFKLKKVRVQRSGIETIKYHT